MLLCSLAEQFAVVTNPKLLPKQDRQVQQIANIHAEEKRKITDLGTGITNGALSSEKKEKKGNLDLDCLMYSLC